MVLRLGHADAGRWWKDSFFYSLILGFIFLLLPIGPQFFRLRNITHERDAILDTNPQADQRRLALDSQYRNLESQWEVRLAVGLIALVLPTLVLFLLENRSTRDEVKRISETVTCLSTGHDLLHGLLRVNHVRPSLERIIELSADDRLFQCAMEREQESLLRDLLANEFHDFKSRLENIESGSILVEGKSAVAFDSKLMKSAHVQVLASAVVDKPDRSFWVSKPGQEYWKINCEAIPRFRNKKRTRPEWVDGEIEAGCRRIFIFSKANIDLIRQAIDRSESVRSTAETQCVRLVRHLYEQAQSGVDVRIGHRNDVAPNARKAMDVLIIDGWIVSKTTEHDSNDGRQYSINVIWEKKEVQSHIDAWWRASDHYSVPLTDVFTLDDTAS